MYLVLRRRVAPGTFMSLIGKNAFRSALNEIYLTGQSLDRDMTEEEIYQTFRSYTPERKLRFLVFHYGYWHGGEFSD